MASCVVSGKFIDANGTGIEGATLVFSVDNPTSDADGFTLMPKEVSTTTDANGEWSLTLGQNVSGVLVVTYAYSGAAAPVKQSFSLVTPEETAATFASCWADSPDFSGAASSFPLYFTDIAGQLTNAQLPTNVSVSGTATFASTVRVATSVMVGTGTAGAPLSFTDATGDKIQLNASAANAYKISKSAAVSTGDGLFKFTAGATSAGEFGFYNGPTLTMFIGSGGNVSVGTAASAGSKVEITKNSTFSSEHTAGLSITTGSSAQPELLLGADNSNSMSYIQSASRSTSFTTVPLVINPNGGKVGIGTTPTETFDIAGSLGVSGGATIGGATTSIARLEVKKSSTFGTENTAGLAVMTGTAGQPELLLGADNGNSLTYIQSGLLGGSMTGTPLVLNPNGGKVGVGMTPTNTFDISGSLGTSGGATIGSTLGVTGVVTLSNLTASLPVQTNGSKQLVSAAIDLSTSQATGTIAAARMPALTGDVTTSAGAVATTVAKIQSTTVSGTTGSGNVVFSASPTMTGTLVVPNINAGAATSLVLKSAGTTALTLDTSQVATFASKVVFKSGTTGLSRITGGDPLSGAISAGSNFAPVVSGANGTGFAIITNGTSGASALVYFYYSNGVAIISQSGAEFVTADPGAGTSKIWIQNTSSTGTLTLTNRWATSQQLSVTSMSNS